MNKIVVKMARHAKMESPATKLKAALQLVFKKLLIRIAGINRKFNSSSVINWIDYCVT